MKHDTRTGDRGETSLLGGGCVTKNDPRIEACGQVDELNTLLGWCGCAVEAPVPAAGRLEPIQRDLFSIGSELACEPGKVPPRGPLIGAEQVGRLETWLDEATRSCAPTSHFVLPGGCESAARLHMARACCRRAERAVVTLNGVAAVRPEVMAYLNRLSDLLFAWARQANQENGVPETQWAPT